MDFKMRGTVLVEWRKRTWSRDRFNRH